jgi:hypothetical protein
MYFQITENAYDIMIIEHANIRKIMTRLMIVFERLLTEHALTIAEIRTFQRQWNALNIFAIVSCLRHRRQHQRRKQYPLHAFTPEHEHVAYSVLEDIIHDHTYFKSLLKRRLESQRGFERIYS